MTGFAARAFDHEGKTKQSSGTADARDGPIARHAPRVSRHSLASLGTSCLIIALAGLLTPGSAHAAASDRTASSSPNSLQASSPPDRIIPGAPSVVAQSEPNEGSAVISHVNGDADAADAGARSPNASVQLVGAAAVQPSEPQQVATSGGSQASLVSYNAVPSDDPDAHPEQLLALFADGTGQSTTDMDEIDLVLGQRQIFTDLRSLEDRINVAQQPTANAVVRHSSQSDHLDITQTELSQDLFFSQGRTQLRLGVQLIDYDPRYGSNITQHTIGLTGNHQFSELAAITGEFWLNQLRSNGTRDTKPTYDTFLTLKPTDTLRFDFDTSRRIFDNIRSLQLSLSATSYGGSVDFTPMEDLRLTLRGAYGNYSDGNERRTEEVEGVWRITNRPVIEIGLRGLNFHFSRLLNDGYFNPTDYYSGEAMFRLQSSLSNKLTVELAGSAGAEHADPGGTKPLFKGSLQLVYKLFGRWSLDGDLSHFSSRQSSSSGFSRTTATLGLHYRFGRDKGGDGATTSSP